MSSKACRHVFQAQFAQIQCRQTAPHTALLKASPIFLYNDHAGPTSRSRTSCSPQIWTHQRRAFTSATRRAAQRLPSMRAQNAPSMMRQNKESIQKAMKEGVQLDYAGILDGTYVKPTGRNLPEFSLSDVSNLWKTLGARWRIFKQDRWARIQDMVALRYSGRWTVKPPLQIVKKKEVKDIAKQFHEEIYTAFAAGDLGPVKDKLAPGFYESLINHMREQRRDTVRQWRIERYVREPKVCSYRLAVMPAEGAAAKKSKAEQAANAYGMIQAVVRIHTVQSMLTRQKKRVWDEVTRSTKTQLVPLNQRGVEISEAGAEEVRKAGAKETVEYFVIQRKFVHSKPQEWQAWGTTVESTPEKLKADAGIRRAKERQLEQERKAGRL